MIPSYVIYIYILLLPLSRHLTVPYSNPCRFSLPSLILYSCSLPYPSPSQPSFPNPNILPYLHTDHLQLRIIIVACIPSLSLSLSGNKPFFSLPCFQSSIHPKMPLHQSTLKISTHPKHHTSPSLPISTQQELHTLFLCLSFPLLS